MSGKSSRIFSIKIATSVSGGGDQDANFMPQPGLGGLTYVGMASGEGTVGAFAADELFHEQDFGRSTPGSDELAAIGVRNLSGSTKFGAPNGEMIRVMYPESISLDHRFKTGEGADPEGFAYGKILGSTHALYKPTANDVTCNGDGAADGTTFQIAAADAAALKVGAPVRRRASNSHLHEYAIITKLETAGVNTTATVHPRFSSQVLNTNNVELCFAFYPVVGTADTRLLRDFHMVFAMGGQGTDATVQRMASLCRCSGYTISQDNFGTLLAMNVRPACVVPEEAASAATITTSEPPGDVLQHRFGCRVDISSNVAGVSAPASGTRANLANFDWNCEVTSDLTPSTPNTRGILGADEMQINNSECIVTLTTENDETLQRMIAKQERRTLILGMGPAKTTGGAGAAMIIANAARNDGAANPEGGDGGRIQQQTALRAVAESGICDVTGLTGDDLRLAQAPFLLAIPRKI